MPAILSDFKACKLPGYLLPGIFRFFPGIYNGDTYKVSAAYVVLLKKRIKDSYRTNVLKLVRIHSVTLEADTLNIIISMFVPQLTSYAPDFRGRHVNHKLSLLSVTRYFFLSHSQVACCWGVNGFGPFFSEKSVTNKTRSRTNTYWFPRVPVL